MLIKIILFLSLTCSYACMPLLDYKSKQSENNQLTRVYCYFGNIWFKDNEFSLKCEFYDNASNSKTCYGKNIHYNDEIVNANEENRFWSFDIENNFLYSKFQVVHNEQGPWATTNIYKISGNLFLLNMSNYEKEDSSSKWGHLQITPQTFANYFISRIDPNLESYCGGYLEYENLNNSMYKYLTTNDENVLKEITWNDEFIGKETNLYEKYNLIKENYSKYKKEKRKKYIWTYIVGAFLLTTAALIVGIRIKNEKVKHK